MQLRVIVIALVFSATSFAVAGAADFGRFVGTVKVEWGKNGRDMKLIEPFAYISPTDVRWDAPAGSIVDGASIPQFAWSIIGGPFEGGYRDASVIHDVACESRIRPWQAAHEAFYLSMLASGVSPVKAKIMHAAVYHFGPRWSRSISVVNLPLASASAQASFIASSAFRDERALIDVRPVQKSAEPCPLCAAPNPDQPPDKADVVITFVPQASLLSQQDFEQLKTAIEINDLPLAGIESFRSASRK